ncbi:fungal-specific transcription factor domain-containing protein [Truncatella angustata]|uniref:Fungal-specific transcription factor domain-containing protein n=1 Tax=Truncatella angustata TaxID=152316 RepID=A0A9P8RHK0_9PEZI|nr:fungal-specific transcription factor domain-containing protein [Truncatella angustata]KAH6646148.1 fungal-specific transcription factor domain-containing protein [Truncatella angustata]
MRTGAIEHLTQRVATLENMFLGQGVLWQQVWRCLDTINQHNPDASQAGELNGSLQEYTSQFKQALSGLQPDNLTESLRKTSRSSAKRQRLEGDSLPESHSKLPWMRDGHLCIPDDLIDSLVEIYFARIHPWIPILHTRRFQENMKIPREREKMKSIFHAIASLCTRFSDDQRLANHEVRSKLVQECRQSVILDSMESFSVESLQALIICAFDTIGRGRGPSAWSIVGSMARTVEQLQLNIENEDSDNLNGSKVLIARMAFLPHCRDWVEEEERRRVFWNVFLMDRFCSIATGWNLSLKGTEVKRRLPCEGTLWRIGEPLTSPTPYFGISETTNPTEKSLLQVCPGADDPSSLGGLSYCIEATESLSLVTSFFLRQVVDVNDLQSIRVWLLRFKQLDLRLVQWKVFLPERWREACARNSDGNMDPNLTLAHLTHNTAVVLLHQGIAYPSTDWQSAPVTLPSVSSADTCVTAAREVAIIADNFLQDADFLTNPQFAFCLFICGRMFLAHAAYYGVDLSREIELILRSLWEVSRRWNGPYADEAASGSGNNLASKFASRLIEAKQLSPITVDLRQAAYSDNQVQGDSVKTASSASTANPAAHANRYGSDITTHPFTIPDGGSQFVNNWQNSSGLYHVTAAAEAAQEASPDSISLAFPPLPMAFQAPSAPPTAMHSPNSGAINLAPGPGTIQFAQGVAGLEDLNSFLDYTFLPDQRVSMFSHPNGPVSSENSTRKGR